MEWLYLIIGIGCICFVLFISDVVLFPSNGLIALTIALYGVAIFCIYAYIETSNVTHYPNCTCEKCTPIAVKEYCPCGCGQYEIVYK